MARTFSSRKGKITAVGRNLSAPGAKAIDATGQYVMPGIVDAHSHIGMWEDGIGEEGSDGNEITDPVTPQLRALDAINPADRSFVEAYEHGVTLVATGPGFRQCDRRSVRGYEDFRQEHGRHGRGRAARHEEAPLAKIPSAATAVREKCPKPAWLPPR